MNFRSLLWVGPALLFSTVTAISVLGWDGKVRNILSISMPNAGNVFFAWQPLASSFICICHQVYFDYYAGLLR